MDYKDYYAVLGLKKGASDKEIRSAFRKLARKHHPDVNQDNKEAEVRFKEVNEANEVLSDPEKRPLYDELGPRWREFENYRQAGGTATAAEFARGTRANPFSAGAGAGTGGRGGFTTTTMSEEQLEEMFGTRAPFSNLFEQTYGTTGRGGRGGMRGPVAGNDIEQTVDITLQEAVLGTTRTISYAEATGQRRIEASIPAGSGEGARIRLSGQGSPGLNGGSAGALYLVVHVVPQPGFELRDRDVHTDIPVDLDVCMLGGEVTVATPKGTRLSLTVPAETQNGRVFRLAGQGLPALRAKGRAGDLYVRLQVVLPTALTDDERDLFARLASSRRSRAGTGAGAEARG